VGSSRDDLFDFSVQGQRYLLPEPAFAPSFGTMLAAVIALGRRRAARVSEPRTGRGRTMQGSRTAT
jgi:hypothetical protein